MEGKAGAGRVLVVDSDPQRRVFLVQILMELGLRVLMAGTAAEAEKMLLSLGRRVDAVMISPQLNDRPGRELAIRFAAEEGGPMVLLVGGVGEESAPPGISLLRRPVTRDKLSALFADLRP